MATKEARTGAGPSGAPTGPSVAPARPARPSALPQGPGYALKRAVLGPPLPTAHLVHERLGKPTALAVFASDNLSSVAYATEEILKVGVPIAGLAAFSMVMPITFGILVVLAVLLFSYRQTIKAYPSSCCMRSRPAAPRSPGWRPSRTACPPSARPNGGTPGPL